MLILNEFSVLTFENDVVWWRKKRRKKSSDDDDVVASVALFLSLRSYLKSTWCRLYFHNRNMYVQLYLYNDLYAIPIVNGICCTITDQLDESSKFFDWVEGHERHEWKKVFLCNKLRKWFITHCLNIAMANQCFYWLFSILEWVKGI